MSVRPSALQLQLITRVFTNRFYSNFGCIHVHVLVLGMNGFGIVDKRNLQIICRDMDLYNVREMIFEPQLGHMSFVVIGHDIISKNILSLLLVQEGQLSVPGESMCTSTV